MKPRTEEEKKISAYSGKLPPITAKQRIWAETHIGQPTAYINRMNSWCSECGNDLPRIKKSGLLTETLFSENRKIVCPSCGKELTIRENSKGGVHSDSYYYTIITTYKGYQVFRHFIVRKHSQRNCESTYSINEAVQNWISKEGKETIIARDVAIMCGYYYDKWVFTSEMSVKHKPRSYYANNRYIIDSLYKYPVRKYIPNMKQYGFKGSFHNITPSLFAKALLSNNDFEYLLKTKQISIFRYLIKRDSSYIPHKYAVNICNRNNYIVKDASLWYDMLDAMEYLGKDLHNPLLVCPANLKAAHDRFQNLKNRKLLEEELRKKREDAMKWEERYRESKGKFFDLFISNGRITISVLKSVKDFLEEGEAMHHCVFSNGYYKRDDSLILSARNINGERIETIEVNLNNFNIMQSRGVCNSKTPFHDEILKLLTDNMFQIQKINSCRLASA